MKTAWTTWLLGGALLASLQWNLRTAAGSLGKGQPDSPACGQVASGSCEAEPVAGGCELDVTTLGLTSGQTDRLEEVCREKCDLADEYESAAQANLVLLRDALLDGESDPDRLRELAAQISEQRERSLAAMVDSLIELREVLEEPQLDAVIRACCRVEGGS